jgi:hypothetical protein
LGVVVVMVKPTVNVRKVVYQKESLVHNKRRYCAPAYSVGVLNEKTKHLDMTIHLTPEARNRPAVRKALVRHETREGYAIAGGKSVSKAHQATVKKDPLRYQDGWWQHLGHKTVAKRKN